MFTFFKKLVNQFPISLVGIFAIGIGIFIAITLDQMVHLFYIAILAIVGNYWECGLFKPTRATVSAMELRVKIVNVLRIPYYGLLIAGLVLYAIFGRSIPVGIALCLAVALYAIMGVVLHFDTPTNSK